MVTIPINLSGGTYKHKSLPLSAQVTRNFWPMKQSDQKALSPAILSTFPGLKYVSTNAAGSDRGLFNFLEVLYKVSGNTLFSVAANGVHTALGTILGNGRCRFAGINSTLVIVSNGLVFAWDTSTNTLTQGTDPSFSTPNAPTSLNSQIIYDGAGQAWMVTNAGTAMTINGLNVADAESSPDKIVRAYAMNQILLLFGERTIEPWWDSGDGNPPFTRVDTGIIQIGLGALDSIGNNKSALYFYGSDDQVYVLQGYNAAPISTETMAKTFKDYGTTSDAIGWCMTIHGHNFYVLTFPTEGHTWIYQEGGEWFELSSGVEGGRWNGNSYVYCYRKHWIADYSNGNLYELDAETYTDNGNPIIRTRDSAPLHGGLLSPQASGKRIEMNRLEFFVETGVGLISGQGSNPVIMLSFSDDGGHTFSTEMWGTIGKMGEFQYKVEWFALGSFDTRIFRIRTSDPVSYQIYSAAADIEIGI